MAAITCRNAIRHAGTLRIGGVPRLTCFPTHTQRAAAETARLAHRGFTDIVDARQLANRQNDKQSYRGSNERGARVRGDDETRRWRPRNDKHSHTYERTRSRPEIREYAEEAPRSQRRQVASGEELLYGVHPCACALASGSRRITRAYIASGEVAHALTRLLAACEAAGVHVVRASRDTIQQLAKGVTAHQGVLMSVSAPADAERLVDAPAASALREDGTPPLALVMDGVVDPHNVGAVLRSAWLLGVDAVISTRKHSAPLTPTVSKTSSGALEYWLASGRMYMAEHLPSLLESFRGKGWRVLGADASEDDSTPAPQGVSAPTIKCVSSADLRRDVPTVLVVGAEGEGIRKTVLQQCTAKVHIEQPARVAPNASGKADASLPSLDSLNVSVATAILLHQLRPVGGHGEAASTTPGHAVETTQRS